MRTGLEVVLEHIEPLSGKTIGLITNPTGVDRHLRATLDLLRQHSLIRLAALFGPEHGVRGDAQAGAEVPSYTDSRTHLPVHSLYGPTKKPTAHMLEGLDALVFDMQDGGSRFYTYVWTMAYALQAAGAHGLEFIVLDRPNPIGGDVVEGPVLAKGFESFVGLYPIPIRHSMTLGELARFFNEQFALGAQLTVVPMENWRRDMYFADTGLPWVFPSPNLPTPDSLLVYPGTCLVEGTNLSEGRGTTRPFEIIGAPWIDPVDLAEALNALDLPGVRFRPLFFTPMFSKHASERCGGVQLHVTDHTSFRPVAAGLHLLLTVRQLYPEHFAWRPPKDGRHFFDLLAGSDTLRQAIDAGRPAAEILESWRQELEAFRTLRQQYLLY